MPSIFFLLLSALILLVSFLELLVFNEEVLLALCFIAFVFFAYSFLGQTVFSIFDDRSKKFETDLLHAFKIKLEGIHTFFNVLLIMRGFSSKLTVLEVLLATLIDH
jgi:hypothetical protein